MSGPCCADEPDSVRDRAAFLAVIRVTAMLIGRLKWDYNHAVLVATIVTSVLTVCCNEFGIMLRWRLRLCPSHAVLMTAIIPGLRTAGPARRVPARAPTPARQPRARIINVQEQSAHFSATEGLGPCI